MKQVFMSWKDYAKKLELELREYRLQDIFIKKTDKYLDKHLVFPNQDSLIKYIKCKAKVNQEISRMVCMNADQAMPYDANDDIIRLGVYLGRFRDRLESYIVDEGIQEKK